MAQEARHARQLMRQRGPGTREIPNADFDYKFGAGTREERQLMRQRGAGTRQINSIDFGFAFATPSQLSIRRSRSRSKTPETASRRLSTARRTPAPADANVLPPLPSSNRSTRSQRQKSPIVQDASRGLSGQPRLKRRRLSEVSNMTKITSDGIPIIVNSDILTAEAQEPVQENGLGTIYEAEQPQIGDNPPSSLFFFPEDQEPAAIESDKESDGTNIQGQHLKPKKRKRKSIGQQMRKKERKRRRKSGTSNSPVPTPPQTQAEDLANTPEEDGEAEAPDAPHSRTSSVQPMSAGIAPASPPTTQLPDSSSLFDRGHPKRRKKRKSVVLGKTKRRSSGGRTSTPLQTVQSIEGTEIIEDEAEPQLQSESMSQVDIRNGEGELPRSAKRPPPSSTTAPRRLPSEEHQQFNVQDDEDADETYEPDEATPEPTPAPKRAKQKQQARPRKALNNRAGNSTAQRTSTTRTSTRSTFPILTYRMTNAYYLPTINEDPEREHEPSRHQSPTEPDELSLPPPALTIRGTPNAVDVLAQICREIIDTTVSNFKSQPSKNVMSRSDQNKRLTALQTFRHTLDTRLFDVSQSLDQRLHLEARLRKSRREKAELQARWLEVRRARDRAALRMDRVRRENWEGEVLGRRAWKASEAAFGAEVAMGREYEDEEGDERQGLEVTLRQVAKDVSSTAEVKGQGGQRGILAAFNGFNAQLERLASVL